MHSASILHHIGGGVDSNITGGFARPWKPSLDLGWAGIVSRALILGVLAVGASLGAQAPTLGAPTTMEYGEVVVGAGGGTITTDPATGAITGTSNLFPTNALPTASSRIVATGRAGRTFTIYTSLAGNITMSRSGGGGTFTTSPGPINSENPVTNTFTFPPSGTVTFHLAGTLSVAGGLAAGDYNGTLPILIQDSNGQWSNTITVLIHIRLIAPLTLTNNADMDMGIVVPGVTAGTVTLNPSTGAQSMTGGIMFVSATGIPAQFAVTGEPSHSITINLGGGTTTLTGPAGTMTLTLSSSVASPTTLSAAGAANFAVGGVVGVAANQPDGNYVGTISVTVAYP